jgi:hypothetical protein
MEVDTMDIMSNCAAVNRTQFDRARIDLDRARFDSALSRPHSSRRSGVVSADLSASYQGTVVPFAGFVGGVAVATIAPRTHKGASSGTTTWSPPV